MCPMAAAAASEDSRAQLPLPTLMRNLLAEQEQAEKPVAEKPALATAAEAGSGGGPEDVRSDTDAEARPIPGGPALVALAEEAAASTKAELPDRGRERRQPAAPAVAEALAEEESGSRSGGENGGAGGRRIQDAARKAEVRVHFNPIVEVRSIPGRATADFADGSRQPPVAARSASAPPPTSSPHESEPFSHRPHDFAPPAAPRSASVPPPTPLPREPHEHKQAVLEEPVRRVDLVELFEDWTTAFQHEVLRMEIWGADPRDYADDFRWADPEDFRRIMESTLRRFYREHGYRNATEPRRRLLASTKYPIHTAAKLGDEWLVRMLLNDGADPTVKTSCGKTAAQIAREQDIGGSHVTVLKELAAFEARSDAAGLAAQGVDGSRQSPLAARSASAPPPTPSSKELELSSHEPYVFEPLFAQDAVDNEVFEDKRIEAELKIDSFCRRHGYRHATTPRWRPFAATKYPIHTAAKLGDAWMVRMLVYDGADPMVKTSRGQTAAQIAREKDAQGSHNDVLQALAALEAGSRAAGREGGAW